MHQIMKKILHLILLSIVPIGLHAQYQEHVFGQMSGYSSIAALNSNGLYDNAALVCERPLYLEAGWTADGFQPFVHHQYIVAQKKFDRDGIGIAYSNLTITAFQRHRLQVAYARTFDKLSVGAKLKQEATIQPLGYETIHSTYFSVGFIYHASEKIVLASQIENATIRSADIPISPDLRFGIGYALSKQVSLQAEAHRFSLYPSRFSAGIQYQPKSYLNMVLGYDISMNRMSAGIQMKAKEIWICVAYKNTQPMGFLPMFSLGYDGK
jgi:hypothetical protein